MTRIANNTLFIEPEKPQQCDYCGKIDELRPYGRDGACICHECGTRPENKEETRRRFNTLLDKVQAVSLEGVRLSTPPTGKRS